MIYLDALPPRGLARPAIIRPAPKELIAPQKSRFIGLDETIAFAPGFRTGVPKSVYDVIYKRNLETSLCLCLDAGDKRCTTGSASQVWSDLSASGADYNRGAGSGSSTDDPSFNGTPGALTSAEYFSCDGGDFFSPVATTTFDDNWHKDGATETVMAIVWIPTTPTNTFRTILGNFNGNPGSTLTVINTNNLSWRIEGSSTNNFAWGLASAIAGAWAIIFVSFNENGGAGASHWNVNGTITAFNGNLTGPGAGAPNGNLQIGRDANGGSIVPNGFRYGCIAAWNRALSQAETASLFDGMRARYGL
ncbi:LamG domain-containing protein [Mesorhizobium sp. Mes31]|uniref:LamG domain-containing protein n=1 Tax=Mesorhizobium sp. Mes31 TaxID=2926017 RepID=UPI0021198D3A|nr:LamG domain-containing protein [Mesorhizobium sp. Mes31]